MSSPNPHMDLLMRARNQIEMEGGVPAGQDSRQYTQFGMQKIQHTMAMEGINVEQTSCTHRVLLGRFCVDCGTEMTSGSSSVPNPRARNVNGPVPLEEEGPCAHKTHFAGACVDCGKAMASGTSSARGLTLSDNEPKTPAPWEKGPCTHKNLFGRFCVDCGERITAPAPLPTTLTHNEAVPLADKPSSTREAEDDDLPDLIPNPHRPHKAATLPTSQTPEPACTHPTTFGGICLACNADTRPTNPPPNPRPQPPYNAHPIPETVDLRVAPRSSRLAGITRSDPLPEGFDTKSLTRAEAREFADLRLGSIMGHETLKESWKDKPDGEVCAAMLGDMGKEILREMLVDELLGVKPGGRGVENGRLGMAIKSLVDEAMLERLGAVDLGGGGRGGAAPAHPPTRADDRDKENRNPNRPESHAAFMARLERNARERRAEGEPRYRLVERDPPPTHEEAVRIAREEYDSKPPARCPICDKLGALRACTGCYRRFYCSPACQRADWAQHKQACRDHSNSRAARRECGEAVVEGMY
ncbi:uncharacterized protein BDZ99DRAFT_517797 [Mytilinidion resinicola]|uniref:MYND-type domain-containing protein n=1 Tax=Mytilinidion resinicola TaxID=574789 RepID=A0A6A6YXJ8_9PEZI|nr:uncharacterized protein BDZ99DRAFT_517797 [Mytilinidion resinicola]KAF2813551.1 hypothetical protein BDZ99DRAFT_517797 [Mytilinidion resinicola]